MGAANWGFEWLGYVGTQPQIRVSNAVLCRGGRRWRKVTFGTLAFELSVLLSFELSIQHRGELDTTYM